ncbi:unnamed protein product [Paramecium sonneborni]|uniref:non-specific serine/threonine protein kinase n=1 Tax=Paramecium sonneborni TaxID=65129 RepID=A0A8S1NZ80_9CILI|nr:unnamed protein product [Paramecium sonneborni]
MLNYQGQVQNIIFINGQKLGEGTEGIVFKGQNKQTNEIVAIKEYKKSINQNELKAIQAIYAKNFSHIIGIKAVQQNQNSVPIIILEFANGEFYKYMQTQDYYRLTYDQKNQYFIQMVQGVDQLHDLGLFHRDLKPENFVYINQPNNQKIIKLIDFGLVKETGNFMAKTACVGVPYYIAPEVLNIKDCFYDKSVDIWSLGAIWYEILTGQTLFNGNSQDELFNQILKSSQQQIDQLIQNNQQIQKKEKELIKRMLIKKPTDRKSLKEIIAAYIQQQVQYQPFQNQQFLNQQPQIQQNQNLYQNQQQQQYNSSQIRPQQQIYQEINIHPNQIQQIQFQQIERQNKDQEEKEKKKQEETEKIQQELKKKMKEEYEQKMKDFESKKVEEMEKVKRRRVDQENEKDKEQLAQMKIQQEIQFQNEIDQFKKKQEEEQQQQIKQYLLKANNEKEEAIKQNLESKEKEIKQQVEMDVQKKYLLEYSNKVTELEKKKHLENQKQLEEKKQSLLILLQSQQNTIQMFISNLKQKLQLIKDLDTQVQIKNQLINFIENELKKQEEKVKQNEQRQLTIQQAFQLEQINGQDNKISLEISSDIQEQNNVNNCITEQQMLLNKSVNDKERIEQQQKEQQKQKEQLNQEKQKIQLQFNNLKQKSDSFQGNIQKFQDKIKFYEKIQYQIQGLEKLQEVIGLYQKIIQDFQVLQQQENNINQFELSKQIITYQSFNIKVEEIQQSQNRLKNQIDETNKFIELIDNKFIDEQRIQLDDLAHNLSDYLDKFKYLSKNEKYKNKIDQIISKIKNCFNQLNYWHQQQAEEIFKNYKQFIQMIESINQDLNEFSKQYNQLHEQIYQDQQIEQQNSERKKKLTNIEGQIKEFIDKMNKLKTQINNLINNQYCNNEYTRNLIMEKQRKIDQNIYQIQEQFNNFKGFNQLISYEIKNQIIYLEQFQEKLKKLHDDELEQVNQLQLVIQNIGAENKSGIEKELLQLTNELQQKQMKFTKALQSVNIDQDKIQYIQKIKEKKEDLYNQLISEIETLQKYYNINQHNQQLFNKELQPFLAKQKQYSELEKILKRLQNYNQEKTQQLERILSNVHNKPYEFQFQNMDKFDKYVILKQKEEQLSLEINSIILQEQNQQQKKKLMIQILKQTHQQIKNEYQKNAEQFQILYALVNYIMQYHLTRYFERIKENEDKSKDKQQNFKEGSYIKAFHDKQNEQTKESTKKEKEAQDLLKIYENILFNNYTKKMIVEMERDYQTIKKEIETQENFIKQKNLVKLRASIKDQKPIKEIINNKQYYKINEWAQMLELQILSRNK